MNSWSPGAMRYGYGSRKYETLSAAEGCVHEESGIMVTGDCFVFAARAGEAVASASRSQSPLDRREITQPNTYGDMHDLRTAHGAGRVCGDAAGPMRNPEPPLRQAAETRGGPLLRSSGANETRGFRPRTARVRSGTRIREAGAGPRIEALARCA